MSKLDFYLWRVKILFCVFRHNWENIYTRFYGKKYSGKNECKRCFKDKYFSGEIK